jgi:hypothetical protein
MRALTQREQRTVRFGGIALAGYLVLFGGLQIWGFISKKHADYEGLLSEARALRQRIILYRSKAEHASKLMESYQMDPVKLERATVLAQASAALQRVAMGGGVMIGPVRESPARPSSKELGSIQLEALGPVPALLKFIQQTHSLGFPLIIDSMQLGSEPTRPGPIKLNLTIVILDFDQWKPEQTHA